MSSFFDQDLLTQLAYSWPEYINDADLFTAVFAGRVVQSQIDAWRTAMRPNDDPNWLTFGTAYRLDLRDRAQVIALHSDTPLDRDAMGRYALIDDQCNGILQETVTLYITSPNFALLRPIRMVLYAIGLASLPTFLDIGYEHVEYRGSTGLAQEAGWLPEDIFACQQTWAAVSFSAAPFINDAATKPVVVNRVGVPLYGG